MQRSPRHKATAAKRKASYFDLKLEYGKIEPREDSIVISYGLKDIKWNLDKNCVHLILYECQLESEPRGQTFSWTG